MSNAIEIRNLTKSYGKARGIIDLSLEVKEGEFYGFIGPNGAGKSTTIRTLLGLISPNSGEAYICGHDCFMDKLSVLGDIGYMPSEAMFYNRMRVGEIIEFSASLRKKECREQAAELCERLKLDTKKRVEELSLGNRKKVAIVCAMQHNPSLYILDEPTSGLDPLMQREFFELLVERNKKGATVFFSSHVLSEVQHYCTRAAVIREGKLIIADTVANIADNNAKRIVIHGVSKPPVDENVIDLTVSGDTVSFLYTGDVNVLLRAVSQREVSDISISEPDLEEIFMHFYTEK